MAQASQLGDKPTTDAERKLHPIVRGFLKHGPGPLTRIGPLAIELKSELLEMDPDRGTVLAAFEPGPQFLQGAGVIQGGVVSAMLDFGFALAGFTRVPEGKSFGTVSMTTNFLKPAAPGRYLVRARIDRAGARMMFASGELSRDGAAGLVATATTAIAITEA